MHGLGAADTLTGKAGNDWLDGGSGVDSLTGGGGADRFVMRYMDASKKANEVDIITDFTIRDG